MYGIFRDFVKRGMIQGKSSVITEGKNIMSKTRKIALLSVSGRKAKVELVLTDKFTKVAASKNFNVAPVALEQLPI